METTCTAVYRYARADAYVDCGLRVHGFPALLDTRMSFRSRIQKRFVCLDSPRLSAMRKHRAVFDSVRKLMRMRTDRGVMESSQ